MTDAATPDPEELRKEIQAVADECDRRYGTNIVATLLGSGAPLHEVPNEDLEPLQDKVYAEVKRHLAVERATDE